MHQNPNPAKANAPPAATQPATNQRLFATDSIAAKPVKPCDRGVSGVLNWRLKTEQNTPGFEQAAPLRRDLRSPRLHHALRRNLNRRSKREQRLAASCSCRCLRPKAIADFAIDLIAAKPVKPCDGGVFGAFYLLSKREWKAAPTGGL